MTDALRALLLRLEAATDGNRLLDATMWLHLGCDDGDVANGRTLAQALEMFPDDGSGIARAFNVPRLSSSLDAAVALAERVLPSSRWYLSQLGYDDGVYQDGKAGAYIEILISSGMWGTGPGASSGFGSTPALALCVAVVRAKLAERPEPYFPQELPEMDAEAEGG